MRNSQGQFAPGGPGFTGKHTEATKSKLRAARAAQANVVGGGPTPQSAYERVMARTRAAGDCMEWTGAVSPKGYGAIGTGSMRDGTRKVQRTHRVVYEHLHGPVPEGFEVDHTCGNRRCVSDAHLEAVTHAVNLERAKARRH